MQSDNGCIRDREYILIIEVSMEQYVIKGGNPLVGEVEIGGAKNAALGILAAAIMTDETVVIDNLPDKDIGIPDISEYRNVSYAIGVYGSSMEPAFQDGDILLVEATQEIEVGDIGIFQINNECFVKKLGEKELISLNKDYKNIPLDETAATLGKVIGKL